MIVGGCEVGHTLGAAGDFGVDAGGRCRFSHGVSAFKSSALCLLTFVESAAIFINVSKVVFCVGPFFVGLRFDFPCGELLLFEDVGCIHLLDVDLHLSRRITHHSQIHAFSLHFGEVLFIGRDVLGLVPWGVVGRQRLCAFVGG